MKPVLKFILSIFRKLMLFGVLISAAPAFAQGSSCDTVYTTVEVQLSYERGISALIDYFAKELLPIISKSENKTLTEKMTIMLTIDVNGKVIDAELSRHRLEKSAEDEMRRKILTMTGWTPGRLNNEPVCCKYAWVIGCIKWG
jgi:hypothetical protein